MFYNELLLEVLLGHCNLMVVFACLILFSLEAGQGNCQFTKEVPNSILFLFYCEFCE